MSSLAEPFTKGQIGTCPPQFTVCFKRAPATPLINPTSCLSGAPIPAFEGQGQSCAVSPRCPQSTPELEFGGLEPALLSHSCTEHSRAAQPQRAARLWPQPGPSAPQPHLPREVRTIPTHSNKPYLPSLSNLIIQSSNPQLSRKQVASTRRHDVSSCRG